MLTNEDKEKKIREKKHLQRRSVICVIITVLIFCGFGIQLFRWQILEGDNYREVAKRSTAYTVKADAIRGEILDCNGNGLAVNKTGYKIVFDKLFMEEDKLNENILTLISLMEKGNEEWIDILPIEVKGNSYVFNTDKFDEIKTLKSEDFLNLKVSDSAEKCINLLCERYKIEKLKSKEKTRQLLSVRYNMELTYYSNTNPYIFATDISNDMVAIVSENMQGVRGVEVQTYLTRFNPQGDLAPHILGALGKINQEEYEEKTQEGKDYGYNDSIGKFGLELAFEDTLKGVGGEKIVQKNADGNVTDLVQGVNAKPGNTLYLTIDQRLQNVANKALETQVKAAKANGVSQSLYSGANHLQPHNG
ncbi:MAG: hypothetical protein ACI4Q8_05590 [Ruminococcus sp.]